tara:strand:- start:440 stop:697 length:258 start_codon:yes stop_codon:yes gene_type:complete
MTSKNKDWIDEILEEEEATGWQIGNIESLLLTSSAECLHRNIDFSTLNYKEAEIIIKELYENNNPTDTIQQYEKMRRAGVFKPDY